MAKQEQRPSKKSVGRNRAKRMAMDPKFKIRVQRNRKRAMRNGDIPWE